MRTKHAAIAVICCSLGLSACSQDASPPPPGPAITRPKTPAAPPRKGPTADELTAGMAAAPAIGKSPANFDLKFELAERPQIGHVLEINLALLPKLDGGPATLQVDGSQGLDAAQDDAAPFEIPEVAAGEVYRHTVHVTPSAEGVLLANFRVTLNHDDISDSTVFSVPVIVDR